MKFRNYLPHDKQLQEGKLAPPVLPKFEDPVAIVPVPEEKKENSVVEGLWGGDTGDVGVVAECGRVGIGVAAWWGKG
ncbi:hypothetical protein Acr_10g0010640 [Actinidia rufa]|uniref:Uncharacterized protein n=1 Tax=Actinidia rufa TaxID=165716 RepID=A0A7J0FBU0_9ERIC|nr:hypothetical protein Acr_10g0010640 [Actinidia rufa]